MRYPDPLEIPGAIFRRYDPEGPLAPPGTYTVALNVGGQSLTETFDIVKDPRLDMTDADFQKLHALLIDIRDKITETHEAVMEIQELRGHVQDASSGESESSDAGRLAKSLITQLYQIEEQLEEPVLAFNEIELRDPGEGTREGEETGAGLPGGEGRGDQGNAMSGLRRLIPPTPRGVIMAPLKRPSNVRGKQVTVWVFINQAGAVDSVRLDPPTPDSRYNSDLMREARDWVFEPAERAGRVVATWYSYTWKL